jgi:hypothetical protein
MWTVEWVDLDGQTTRQDSCLESNSLSELYRALQVEKANAAKRKSAAANPGASGSSAKRLRGMGTKTLISIAATPATTTVEASEIFSKVPGAQETVAETLPLERSSPEVLPNEESEEDSATGDKKPSPSQDALSSATQTASASTPTSSSLDPFFYLLKPSTVGTAIVLIPMDASQTLTESLSNHVVLEFPTIYILRHSPDELNAASTGDEQRYITEETYLASQQAREALQATRIPHDQSGGENRGRDADRDNLNSGSSARAGIHGSASGANATIAMSAEQRASMKAASREADAQRARQEAARRDPNKILEMLRRDLSGMM